MLTRVPSVRLSGVLLMPQHKIVEAYLESAIPQKVTEDTKARLRAELECHIFDRADFYMEIGYDEETAFEKAIEQMGEGEEVKTELESLYKDSTLKGLLWFFGLCAVNLITISPWGYWHFVEPNMYASPSIAVLSVYLAVWVFLIVHTVTCFRQKLYKQLTGITSAVGLIAFGSIITNGILFPVLNSGRLIIRYITDGPDAESDIPIAFVTVALMAVYTVLCLIKLFSEDKLRKKPYRLSLKKITRFLSFISICFVVLYGFAYDRYEWCTEEYFAEDAEIMYISSITSEQKNVYDALKIGDSKEKTENLLIKNGFAKQSGDCEEFCEEHYFIFEIEEMLKNRLELVGERNYVIYSKILYMYEDGEELDGYDYDEEEEYDYNDVFTIIIVSYDSNKKLDYKLYLPDANSTLGGYYLNRYHGSEAENWFNSLKKGDDCEAALEFIRNTGAMIIEDDRYGGKSIYMIFLNCYYPEKESFVDFLFGLWPDDVRYSLNFEIRAEDGIITETKNVPSRY